MRHLAIVAMFVFVSLCCPAQKTRQQPECFRTAKTQFELNECANDEAKRADAELNRVYKKLLSAVSSDSNATEKVKTAQRAWVVYRDAYIDAMYPEKDKQLAYGSIFPMEVGLLMADLTKTQTKALEKILEQAGASQ